MAAADGAHVVGWLGCYEESAGPAIDRRYAPFEQR
jgi:hypothetical protein